MFFWVISGKLEGKLWTSCFREICPSPFWVIFDLFTWGILYPLTYQILEWKPSMAAFFFHLVLFSNVMINICLLCVTNSQVYLSLCCALVASAAGAYLHLLLNVGGLLTTFACIGSILWLFSTPQYEEVHSRVMRYRITSLDHLVLWEWQFLRMRELNRHYIFCLAAKEVWSAHGDSSLWRSLCRSSHWNGHQGWPKVYFSSLVFLVTSEPFSALMHWILCDPVAPPVSSTVPWIEFFVLVQHSDKRICGIRFGLCLFLRRSHVG